MKFYIPSASFMPGVSMQTRFEFARKAGFDGVEVLLTPGLNHDNIRTLAFNAGVEVGWHEVWSWEDGRAHAFNWAAAAAGIIPWKTAPLEHQLPWSLREHVVAYAHRVLEDDFPAQVWFQTAPVAARPISYDTFLAAVKTQQGGVVFDTLHVLELYRGVIGIDNLPWSPTDLREWLRNCWDDLAEHVHEIHFNNFLLKRGATKGRNVWPDQGDLDLSRFVEKVKGSGWDGIVTPEVFPREISDHPLGSFGWPSLEKLARLREVVDEMWR